MENYTQLHQHYLDIVKMEGLTSEVKSCMIQHLVTQLPGSGWLVKGITRNALAKIVANDYHYSKEVKRGHLKLRKNIYQNLVENPITDYQEWLDYILENTTTYLCTAAENGVHGTDHWSEMLEFADRPDWLFETAKIGYKHRKAEREWIREFHAKNRR